MCLLLLFHSLKYIYIYIDVNRVYKRGRSCNSRHLYFLRSDFISCDVFQLCARFTRTMNSCSSAFFCLRRDHDWVIPGTLIEAIELWIGWKNVFLFLFHIYIRSCRNPCTHTHDGILERKIKNCTIKNQSLLKLNSLFSHNRDDKIRRASTSFQ